MTEYVQIPCVQCSRTLRVRLEYIGHEIACNHCGQAFLATSSDPRVLQFLLQVQKPFHEERKALKSEIEQLRSQSDALRAELEAARDDVETIGQERDRLAADRTEMEQWRREAESKEDERRAELVIAHARIAAEQQHHHQEVRTLEQHFEQLRQERQVEVDSLTEQATQLHQDRKTLLEQIESIRIERDGLVASLAQLERTQRDAARAWCDERVKMAEDLEQERRQHEAAASHGDDLAREIGVLQADLVQQQERELRQKEELERFREQAAALEQESAARQRELERVRDEVHAACSRAQSERRDALDNLAQEQARSEDARKHWQERLTSIERQFVEQSQGLQIDLGRAREVAAGLHADRAALLRQIEVLQQDHQRLVADASEVVLARKTQRRAVVKIARLTRSLERAWKQIEVMRLRFQELTSKATERREGDSPKYQSTTPQPAASFSPVR